MKARAVNVRTEEWDVYVGRGRDPKTKKKLDGARYSNPFPVDRYGKAGCMRRFFKHLELNPLLVAQWKVEHAAKRLGCWCKPAPCHADVWAGLANGKSLDEIKREWDWLLAETTDLFTKEAK